MLARDRRGSQSKKKRKNVLRRCDRLRFILFFALVIIPAGAWAHNQDRPAALRDVALEQKLGAQVPLGLEFRDERGRAATLGEYFGKRPVILSLVYLRCQDLCPLVLDGLLRTLRALSLGVGREFDVLTVSFDPRDTPALAEAKKAELVQRYGRPLANQGWHFLTGGRESIEALTRAVGFKANYEGGKDRYAHATGIMLVTPQGKIARYFYGVEFSPRDIRLGLSEAANGEIGSPIDQLLLFCYHYDPATGRYSLLITRVLRLAGIATALVLAGSKRGARLKGAKTPGSGVSKSIGSWHGARRF